MLLVNLLRCSDRQSPTRANGGTPIVGLMPVKWVVLVKLLLLLEESTLRLIENVEVLPHSGTLRMVCLVNLVNGPRGRP